MAFGTLGEERNPSGEVTFQPSTTLAIGIREKGRADLDHVEVLAVTHQEIPGEWSCRVEGPSPVRITPTRGADVESWVSQPSPRAYLASVHLNYRLHSYPLVCRELSRSEEAIQS